MEIKKFSDEARKKAVDIWRSTDTGPFHRPPYFRDDWRALFNFLAEESARMYAPEPVYVVRGVEDVERIRSAIEERLRYYSSRPAYTNDVFGALLGLCKNLGWAVDPATTQIVTEAKPLTVRVPV